MPIKDAAIVALLLTIAGFFTVYMPLYAYSHLLDNLGEFCYESIRYLGSSFFTYLVTLTGISRYIVSKEK